eukprot:SAG31_NODE_22473_length_524_cov_2.647059_1_plen_143_part_01
MARVLLGISPDLVDDLCTMQAIKSATHQPEMFQADKLCGMSMIYSVFHRHSDNNHGFMRALKNALSSLPGLLANKSNTLNTLKTIMKSLIVPAKKMNLRVPFCPGRFYQYRGVRQTHARVSYAVPHALLNLNLISGALCVLD